MIRFVSSGGNDLVGQFDVRDGRAEFVGNVGDELIFKLA